MDGILVTGVGGGVGQSIIKALQDTAYHIVGVDSEPLASGLHGVPMAYLGCPAVAEGFIGRLLDICHREQCRLIFVGHDVELLPLAQNMERFIAEGIFPVVSSPEVVRICDDKLATTTFLKEHGFPVLETRQLKEAVAISYPVVLKPQRGGARSRNTYVVHNPKELEIYRALVDVDNCIVQEYLDGDEYTCGSVTLEGHCAGVIVMRRILRAGDTYKAFVERNAKIESAVRDIVEALQPIGACNVQLRMKNGDPFVFEINARCSGTTAARALAGFNEPKMIADHYFHSVDPRFTIREISILRYWRELVIENDRIEQLSQNGFLAGNDTRL